MFGILVEFPADVVGEQAEAKLGAESGDLHAASDDCSQPIVKVRPGAGGIVSVHGIRLPRRRGLAEAKNGADKTVRNARRCDEGHGGGQIAQLGYELGRKLGQLGLDQQVDRSQNGIPRHAGVQGRRHIVRRRYGRGNNLPHGLGGKGFDCVRGKPIKERTDGIQSSERFRRPTFNCLRLDRLGRLLCFDDFGREPGERVGY